MSSYGSSAPAGTAVAVLEQVGADRLRETLRSLDGEDPDSSGFGKLLGRWWEPLQVDTPEAISGRMGVERFEVPEWSGWLTSAQIDGRMVPPGAYTRLVEALPGGERQLWMSDTPSEILDTLPFVWSARGRVVILGLGLGMVPRLLAAMPDVTAVDVIEADADVIALTAPDDPKVAVHHGDAFDARLADRLRPDSGWDVALYDIWPDIGPDIRSEAARLAELWPAADTTVWALDHWAAEEARIAAEFGVPVAEVRRASALAVGDRR